MSKRKGVLNTNIRIQLLFLGSKTFLLKKKRKGGQLNIFHRCHYFSQMSLLSL